MVVSTSAHCKRASFPEISICISAGGAGGTNSTVM